MLKLGSVLNTHYLGLSYVKDVYEEDIFFYRIFSKKVQSFKKKTNDKSSDPGLASIFGRFYSSTILNKLVLFYRGWRACCC